MAVFGIVAEYNPFHNGHKYQIDKIKKDGDFVVAVMSPNVVQRGDFALLNKWIRTRAALSSGVDLVLELPSFYALSTAEKFAFGAVSILDALGCIDFLCFGSESADIKLLYKTAEISKNPDIDKRIGELLKNGITYAKARAQAIGEMCPECQEIISNPNDILGIEYISALKKINSKIKPFPILRVGTAHDSQNPYENYASASFLRENLTYDNLKKFVPQQALGIYNDALKNGDYSLSASALSQALLLKLRLSSAEDIRKLSDVSEGLENRIIKAAQTADSIEALCEQIKTKRYTLARIRRILMYTLLDFPPLCDIDYPQYIRILGASDKGLSLLSSKSATLPIVTSLAKARELGDKAQRLVKIEENCTSAFNLSLKNPDYKTNEFTQKSILP